MNNPNPHLRNRLAPKIVLGLLAACGCAAPVQAQYVNTVVSNNLNTPGYVAVDSSNNVYISDSGNNRIALFSPTAGTLTTLAGSGDFGTNNGNGVMASFSQPAGIVAARGGLVVADEEDSLIRFVTYSGAVSTLAGQPYYYGSANGPGATATFSFPVGVAVDSLGNIFVADSQNNVIRLVDTNNNVSTIGTGSYHFNNPNAVAVDNNGFIWVADTGNSVICMISNGVVTVVAGTSGKTGTNNSPPSAGALFNEPRGLLWVPASSEFLITDTGNNTVRSLTITGPGQYEVTTVAGLPGQPGFVNGSLAVAQFNTPIGMCVDATDVGYYVIDSDNNALRVLQATAPLPPIAPPEIGYVSFPIVGGVESATFNNITGSSVVFNNSNIIAIMADPTASTYMTYGVTGSMIATPSPTTGTSPPIYTSVYNGQPPSGVPASVLPVAPDLTVNAISEASGRPSSSVVSARIQYVTANPTVTGNNAADIELTDTTVGAVLYYTTDGLTPTNDGSSGVGVEGGTILSLDITNNVELLVRAFTPGFAPSQVVSNELYVTNVVGNQLNWGFESGPASTHFITALNLGFTAPLTYSQIPSSMEIYALQFDVLVTNLGATPAPAFSFTSDLLQPVIGEANTYAPIPPGMYYNGATNPGIITTQQDALEIFWLVTPPVTNLYSSSELMQYSAAAQEFFDLDDDGVAVVGTLSFVVPSTATPGNPYSLQIAYPSASSYAAPLIGGPPIDVFVQVPTNGSTTGVMPNAVKSITVLSNNSPASAHLVGDVFPYTWYNIGDFGDGLLQNDDVILTMEYAGSSGFANNPFFDAMDSSNGATNDNYSASDSFIDTMGTGDGMINVDDVYVTLRRSLDPSLTNYTRYWTGTSWVPTVYTNSVQQLGLKSLGTKLALSAPQPITVAADQVQTGGGLTAQVPIRVQAAGSLPLRVFMLNVTLQPLDGSPAITNAVTFTAVTNLGAPYATVSQSANNYAAGWLNSTVSGVSGANIIGTLSVTLPPNVNSNSAYRIHFNHFSGSPNGLALFRPTIQDGLITVGNRNGSSWHDGIPDNWRLLWFGTISNALSAASLDPDGDGANNWQEYIAGTDPLDAGSVFKFMPVTTPAGGQFTLEWPSVVNKIYSVQSSSALGAGWTTVASNLIGNSEVLQWTDTNAIGPARYYRAVVQ